MSSIKINDKEYKLSQYTDDTQIFLDGSEKSFKLLMYTQKQFYNIYGLKTNEEKTKALWVGSMCKSEKRICKEYNLDLD